MRAYLSQDGNRQDGTFPNMEAHDQFLAQINAVLSDWGTENIWTGFSIAGLKLDELLKQNGGYLGIDLISSQKILE